MYPVAVALAVRTVEWSGHHADVSVAAVAQLAKNAGAHDSAALVQVVICCNLAGLVARSPLWCDADTCPG